MIFVIGAGLAGLAAALALADAGRGVTVLEAGKVAGGRCRSYVDQELGCLLDNGNHLLLSGNDAAMAWLDRLGTRDTLAGPGLALFPFIDARDGARWVLRPSAGRLPGWLFDAGRRVPGTVPADYLALLRWLRPRPGATVATVAGSGVLADRLIVPLAISALNTMPEVADAGLMGAVVRQSLLRGGRACVPGYPRQGLSESLIDPALAALRAAGAVLRFGCRVSGLRVEQGRVTALGTAEGDIGVGANDAVVLAVPANIAAGLLPGLAAPDAFESILNVHFRAEAAPGPAGFTGMVGGFTEWVFVKPGVVSVTVSAANRHAERDAPSVAALCWPEVCLATGLAGPMPAYRVVREKRATFAATPAQAARRPGPGGAGLQNLALAGDWTNTGLPATIEGALRSGAAAAAQLRG